MTGAVSITHTGSADVAIDNGTTALNLGTVSVGQNFEARSGNGITDSGVITVAGTSLFHSDITGKVITLRFCECDDRCGEYNSYGFSECRD